ncbi:MAG: EamA family transporter [Deltaproteobacteria bacterium]|nr:EamA family transporter [Deltaproteobacteria bacterium]
MSCGVLSQIFIKWRVNVIYPQLTLPTDSHLSRLIYLVKSFFFDPVVILCFIFTFLSGILWMASMTKLPISVAYPLMSLGYALVLVISCLFLNESFNLYKLAGILFIIVGITISSQG